ncbi:MULTISPECIES: hypothetical protein [Micromonospora]|uniref:hypothetical protein n=1 Tax=Micromonospora TaxID=1873 RepID=UPI0006AF9C42|nr:MULTISPECIES: hypothetical protein [Micromonospora]KOX06647.1 hypothetical protein ADK66_22555 [Micromonospora sp. NRRL B-16802]NJC13090.1 hypothetical protein [Micromonospora profundi]
MRDLERRYQKLLWAYPAGYRQARGAEIVCTYLDLAGPDRRWPSILDVTDVLAGGVRERLRAAGAADLLPGVRLAAVLSFLTATALAGFWAAAEVVTTSDTWGAPSFGPFATTGIVVWACWLLAAVVHVVAPARVHVAIGLALSITAAVVPVAALFDLPRPYLFVLVPQASLGILALAIRPYTARRHRLMPLATASAAALIAVGVLSGRSTWFYRFSYGAAFLPEASAALLLTAMLTAAVLSLRGDARGLWALLVLFTPVGLLALYPLTENIAPAVGAGYADFRVITATAAIIFLLGGTTLAVALTIRVRSSAAANTPALPVHEPCPNCGK